MSNMFQISKKYSLQDIISFFRQYAITDAQFVAYINSLPPLQQKAAKRLVSIPTCQPAPTFPSEMKNMGLSFVCTAWNSLKSEHNELNNANAMETFVAFSNITEGYKVSYSEGIATISSGDQVIGTLAHQAHMVTVKESETIELPLKSVAIEAAKKITFVADFDGADVSSNKFASAIGKPIAHKSVPVPKLIRGGVAISPWVETLNTIRLPFNSKGSVLERIKQMASYENLAPLVNVLAKGDTKPPFEIKLPEPGSDLAKAEFLLSMYTPTKTLTDYYKFYDIPSQWLNAPMKWGAVLGFLHGGDMRRPCKSFEGSLYFGAAGGRAHELFRENSKCYDVKIWRPLNFGKNVTDERKRLMNLHHPKWDLVDMFKYEKTDKEFLYSDVWHNTITDEEIEKMVMMVSPTSVIKFNGKVNMVKNFVVKYGKFPLTILVTSRPLFVEYFLTQVVYDDDKFGKGCYYYVARDGNELVKHFKTMILNVVHLREKFKLQHVQSILNKIPIKYRPFKVEPWMMPMMVTTGRNKLEAGLSKHVDLNSLSLIVGEAELAEEMETVEDGCDEGIVVEEETAITADDDAEVMNMDDMLNALYEEEKIKAAPVNNAGVKPVSNVAPSPSPSPSPSPVPAPSVVKNMNAKKKAFFVVKKPGEG